MSTVLEFVIYGEPASKANSRELVTRKVRGADGKAKTRPMFIKSEKARLYVFDALRQIPPACRVRLEGPVFVTLDIYYASERPDLDESVVLDVMQDQWKSYELPNGKKKRELVQAGVYRNDRQVRKKLVTHYIDVREPRAVVRIEPFHMQQGQFNFEENDEERDSEDCAF